MRLIDWDFVKGSARGWQKSWRCALGLFLLLATIGAAPQVDESPSTVQQSERTERTESRIPHVDPQASSGVVPFGDIKLQLELGRWNVEQINQLLVRAQTEYPDPNARFSFLLEQFLRSPFAYEAQSSIPPAGTMRLRLQSFGCTGLVISLLALTNARSFEEFAHSVRQIRYWQTETRGVDSDPVRGNILDFAEEVFLLNARTRGFLTDVTAEVAGKTPLSTFRSRNIARYRSKDEDRRRHRISPKVSLDKIVSLRMLSSRAFSRMDRSRIKSGDILLFSHVKPGPRVSRKVMFGHMGIAINRGGEIYMIHATRDFLWRPKHKRGEASIASGVYLNDPRREQIGVGLATDKIKDPRGRRTKIKGILYFGHAPNRLRTVHKYLAGTFTQGVTVLRPKNLPHELRIASREFLAAAEALAQSPAPATKLAAASSRQ